MSEVWPFDIKKRSSINDFDSMRPFKCLLLMPFEKRFNQVAELIEQAVRQRVSSILLPYSKQLPEIERLDWITSSGVIQQEIWQKISDADLVFCDITGYNPNVMFEAGVCSAWKNITQVVFIKDHFFKQQSAFDIAPIRYTEYESTTEGLKDFYKKIFKLTENVVIAFPDQQGNSPKIELPFQIDFKDNRDDLRIYTPPFAHRRVINKSLEFGSLFSFPFSWASIGKDQFLNFQLEFSARFVNPLEEDSWIGIGLRSQNYYANYAHIFYLRKDGSIVITEPNEEPPKFYEDIVLREPTKINTDVFYNFQISFDESKLDVQIDDFHPKPFDVKKLKKDLGPGLLRIQASKSWMAIKHIKLS